VLLLKLVFDGRVNLAGSSFATITLETFKAVQIPEACWLATIHTPRSFRTKEMPWAGLAGD